MGCLIPFFCFYGGFPNFPTKTTITWGNISNILEKQIFKFERGPEAGIFTKFSASITNKVILQYMNRLHIILNKD